VARARAPPIKITTVPKMMEIIHQGR
jgi:hypothetical protein